LVSVVPSQMIFDLGELPQGATLRSVTAGASEAVGRRALRVELTDEVTFSGSPGVDYVVLGDAMSGLGGPRSNESAFAEIRT